MADMVTAVDPSYSTFAVIVVIRRAKCEPHFHGHEAIHY